MRPGSPISGVSAVKTSRTRNSVIARSSTGNHRSARSATTATSSGRPTTSVASTIVHRRWRSAHRAHDAGPAAGTSPLVGGASWVSITKARAYPGRPPGRRRYPAARSPTPRASRAGQLVWTGSWTRQPFPAWPTTSTPRRAPAVDVPDDRSVRDDATAFVLGGVRRAAPPAGGAPSARGWASPSSACSWPSRCAGCTASPAGRWKRASCSTSPSASASGDVPNVDFLHLYGPGSLQVLAGWYDIFGNSLPAERTFGLLQHVGHHPRAVHAGPGLGTGGRDGRRRAVGVLRDDADRLDGDGLERRPGADAVERRVRRPRRAPARSAATPWAWRGRRRAGRPRAHATGRTSSSPSGWCYGWLCWRHAASRRPVAARRRRSGCCRCGSTSSMAGPVDAFEGMVLDPVFRLRDGRALPRPPSWGRLDGGLQAVAEEIPPWWRFPALSASQTLFLWFFLMLIGTAAMLVPGHLAAAAATRLGPLDGAARRRPRQRRHPPAGAAAARTRPTCCG